MASGDARDPWVTSQQIGTQSLKCCSFNMAICHNPIFSCDTLLLRINCFYTSLLRIISCYAVAYNRNIYFFQIFFLLQIVVCRFCTAWRFCAIDDKMKFGSTFGQPQIDLLFLMQK